MSIRLQPVDLSSIGWTPTTDQVNDAVDNPESADKVLATPLSALTTEAIAGTGAFDVLMRSAKLHLQEEYDNQRITGTDYTTVYMNTIAAVLQTSIQFLLNEQQVQEINARIGLIRQQTVTELTNTDDNIPMGLGHNFIPNVITPIPVVNTPGGAL